MKFSYPYIGILGGGQLGRMLLQEAASLDIQIAILDPSPEAPCSYITPDFTVGDYKDYQTVVNFGADKDVISIEFEDVNVEALETLERMGKQVFPSARVLRIIKDKGLQKQFYTEHQIPTGPYQLVNNAGELLALDGNWPKMQKLRTSGYDGYGVRKITHAADSMAFDAPSVVEEMVAIEKELAVIIARNPDGAVESFPAVEMYFNPVSHMVDYLFSPADITPEQEREAQAIAHKLVTTLDVYGILAVEFFLTTDGKIWVNEIAPRPHNSGHHTIEANYTSQFGQHLRAICNLPLGTTQARCASAMINLTGHKDAHGEPFFEHARNIMHLPGVFFHIYGKKQVKPFRKMGHVTLCNPDITAVRAQAAEIAKLLKVTGQPLDRSNNLLHL